MLKNSLMLAELSETYLDVKEVMDDCHAHYFVGIHEATGHLMDIKIEKEPFDEDAETLEYAISDRPEGTEDWNRIGYLEIEK